MGKLFVGLDVSLAMTSVCVVDHVGAVVFETKVETSPTAIASALRPFRARIATIGHEASSLTPWLQAGLLAKRMPSQAIDAMHAHAVLSTQRHKTDRNDALGIARLLSAGWVKPAHVPSQQAVRLRVALNLRRILVRKIIDLELSLRNCLKPFGIRLGVVGRARYAEKVLAAISHDRLLVSLAEGILRARDVMLAEADRIERDLKRLAAADDVCTRLMTVPGVGPITALCFKATVDDPKRFRNSRAVSVYFGLTPRRRQSGETDRQGRISKRGDMMMRSLLYGSAATLLRARADSRLKRWGQSLALRSKRRIAVTAVARKLGAVMHRIWVDDGVFQLQPSPPQLTG